MGKRIFLFGFPYRYCDARTTYTSGSGYEFVFGGLANYSFA